MRTGFLLFTTVIVSIAPHARGQGFINLNFESSTATATAPGSAGSSLDPAVAFPGWTVGGSFTLHNNLTLGSTAQVLVGPSYPNFIGYSPLEGSFSALIQFGPGANHPTPLLRQTGLIPADARSITFLMSATHSDARVTMNGVEIQLTSIGGNRMAGDISVFAGTTAELAFSTHSYEGSWLYFDDVTFSTAAVPEPSPKWLLSFGALALFLHRRRGFRRQNVTRAA